VIPDLMRAEPPKPWWAEPVSYWDQTLLMSDAWMIGAAAVVAALALGVWLGSGLAWPTIGRERCSQPRKASWGRQARPQPPS
jgi:hypothetical protein